MLEVNDSLGFRAQLMRVVQARQAGAEKRLRCDRVLYHTSHYIHIYLNSRNARGLIEWQCTQERWNPEVAITFSTATRYQWAIVFSSHYDTHPDNSAQHTGKIQAHSGFVMNLFFISPRTGHRLKVFEMLRAFSFIS
jgi:hypothetical protein